MKILITAAHWPVASGRYVYDALKRLGHDVKSMGPSMGTRVWDMDIDPKWEWVPDTPAKDWEPDLVIHMDGNEPPPPKNRKWKHARYVLYGVDNHVRDYRFGGFEFDHLFLAHPSGYRVTEETAEILPCGYDPAYFSGGPAWDQRTIDAALIAVMYPHRWELIGAVLAKNPGMTATYGTGKVYDDYAALYRNARISLVRAAHDDVAMRVFETAAMGCLVVMDRVSGMDELGLIPFHPKHANPDANCIVYNTPDEAGDIVDFARREVKVAAKIALNGQQWAANHTWDARAARIVEWAENE